jgi:uncharacterized protein YndB with AHSA1/START domain
MSIAPIIKQVQVKAAPARAFDLFATRMGEWWTKGQTLGAKPHAAIIIEPQAGGRWFERDADGVETNWGKVLAWEPPERLLLGWQINGQWRFDAGFLTEVELSFAPLPGGGTLVTLEHRQLERFGTDAAAHAEKLDRGWPRHVADFAAYADRES